MSSNWQNTLIARESFDLFGNTTIIGTFHGIVIVLYCLCARVLCFQLQGPDKCRQARFILTYISFVFVCTMGLLIVGSPIMQLAYVNHADTPGGPMMYTSTHNPTTKIYLTASGAFDIVIEVSTMVIQIWRLWLIWGRTQYAMAVSVLPLLLLLSYIGLQALNGVASGLEPLESFGISFNAWIRISAASYAILSTLTIFVTGMVAARLLLVRRHHIRLMGTSEAASPYVSIITMLIESYALDSVWSLATAISLGLSHPSQCLLLNNDSTVKVIAYFLVVYRVVSGRGWTRNTGQGLTSLQWNRDAQIDSDESTDIHCRELTTTMGGVTRSPSVSQLATAV